MKSWKLRDMTGIVLLASLVLLRLPAVAQAQDAAPDPVTPSGEGTEANPYLISQLGHLVWMGETVAASAGKHYTLQNDLDASGTTNWNDGSGFAPIGNGTWKFMGCLDGNGKAILDLYIHRPGQNFVGLIGFADSGSVVKDLRLSGGSVNGATCVGSLAGCNAGAITGCRATGPVTGISSVGGLVGLNQYGSLERCYATGSVIGSGNYVGGLTGGNDQSGGTVNACYAAGAVTGNTYVGGLVGANSNGGRVDQSYAAGPVVGAVSVGGLTGYNDSAVEGSYWDTTTTGQAGSAGGLGRTTAQMKQQATFAGWDFTNVWRITEDVTYPLLAGSNRIVGVSGNLAFGNVTTGTTAQAAMTLTNSGSDTLTVTGLTATAGFSASWSGTIEAGGSRVVQVTFRPVDIRDYAGTITVNSDKTEGEDTLTASGTGVAPPQPGQIRFSASAYLAQEGVVRKVFIQRINGSSGTVSVNYVSKPQTALAWKDYTPVSGTLTWTNGQTASKVLKIPIRADGKTEGNETFSLVLKNPVGTTLGTPLRATITIQANSKGTAALSGD